MRASNDASNALRAELDRRLGTSPKAIRVRAFVAVGAVLGIVVALIAHADLRFAFLAIGVLVAVSTMPSYESLVRVYGKPAVDRALLSLPFLFVLVLALEVRRLAMAAPPSIRSDELRLFYALIVVLAARGALWLFQAFRRTPAPKV